MAITRAGYLAGDAEARALQLIIEYDPQPPYDSGSVEKADPYTKRCATEILTQGLGQPVRSNA